MVWRAILRLILVPLGFVLALCAALFVLFTLGQERIVHEMAGGAISDDWAEIATTIMTNAELFLSLASAFTIVPALLLIIIGEVSRIRSGIYYIVGGGVVLAAIPVLARLASSTEAFILPSATILQIFATAGFAAGLVYWLIAGRTA